MCIVEHQLSDPQWSAVSQKRKKFSDKRTQLFDVIHGVQHNGYLKASHIIRRNISVWLPSYIVSHRKEIYSNKTIT